MSDFLTFHGPYIWVMLDCAHSNLLCVVLMLPAVMHD